MSQRESSQDKLGNPLRYMKIKMQQTKTYGLPLKHHFQGN